MAIDDLKRAAGVYAANLVQSGMVVGLGSGSTASYATRHLAERLRAGDLRGIVGVPTSRETADLARQLGIPLTTLSAHRRIDMTIDGADEVDPNLDLIKGLGGCLLHEKIVAHATETEVIVVDDSKRVAQLGTRSPLPVEVTAFGWENTRDALAATGARCVLRAVRDEPVITDEGNLIVDCTYSGIAAPTCLMRELNAIPGVVENGLFLGYARIVVVASAGGLQRLDRVAHVG